MVRDLFNELGLGSYTPSQEVLQKQKELSDLSQTIANTQAELQAQREAQVPIVVPIQDSTNQIPTLGELLSSGFKEMQSGADSLIKRNQEYYGNRDGNIFMNIVRDINDMGTGLVGIAAHPWATLESVGGYIGDTNRYQRALNKSTHFKNPILRGIETKANEAGIVAKDFVNLIGSTYGISTADATELYRHIRSGDLVGAGKKFGKDVVTAAVNIYKHPVYTALDVATLGVGKTGLKTAEVITKRAAGKASTAIDTSVAKVKSKTYPARDAFNEIKKQVENPLTGEYNGQNLNNAIEALETAKTVTSQADKVAAKALAKAVNAWDNSVPDAYKIDNFTLAHNQRMVREGLATSVTDADKYTQQFAKSKNESISLTKALEELDETPKHNDMYYKVMKDKLGLDKETHDGLFGEFSVGKKYSGKGVGLESGKVGTVAGETPLDIMKNPTIDKKVIGDKFLYGEDIAKHETLHSLLMRAEDLSTKGYEKATEFIEGAKRALRGADGDLVAPLTRDDLEIFSNTLEHKLGSKEVTFAPDSVKRWIDDNIPFKKEQKSKGFVGKNAPAKKVEYDWDMVKQAAKDGDVTAKNLLESKALYDKGYLKLVPHGLAEVAKDIAGQALTRDERIFAGKYSSRVYGTATYDNIADQIKNADEWLDKQIQHFTEAEIAREIVEDGTIGGQKLVEDVTNTKNIVYLDKETLLDKDLGEAINKALDTPTPNSIAIDKDVITELANQFKLRSGKPFGERWMNEIHDTAKQNLLASGGYLAGNAITGANNAIMNSGFNPVTLAQDIIDASKTKGKLAKEMGIYRELGRSTATAKNPLIKGVQKVNSPIADTLNYIDAKMQNTFVEMAAHNRLRSQGIGLNQRATELMNMDKVKLAQSIHDARMIGLLNPNRTLLPRALHSGASVLNPFWRWIDTAAQSSMYMMQKHPVVNNIVLNEFGARIGYDQEMQRRMKLGVTSDKPFVSYRYNAGSKKLEEVSCEFIPQLNTMRLIGDTALAIEKGKMDELPFKIAPAAVPFFGAVLNATYGKDKYGRPLLRPEVDRRLNGKIQVMQGDKRYHFVPNETIGFEEIKGGMGDEVLSAAINELIAYPKLLNRMVLPAAAGVSNLLTGGNTRYYKPYPNQVIGEFGKGGEMPEYANPRSSAAGAEVLDILGGKFSRQYDPMMEMRNDLPLNPQVQKQLMRGFGNRLGRDNMILQGGL